MMMTFVPRLITLPGRNDDGATKRAHDEDLLTLIDEADARGWSSVVSHRSLMLRHWWALALGLRLGRHCLPRSRGVRLPP
jgi:hypothetical protein